MKERPILFSAPMVRAILDGRKVQTRRIVKGADYFAAGWPCKFGKPCAETRCLYSHVDGKHLTVMHSPYGGPEDRLWVRETWQGPLVDDIDAYRAEPSNYHNPEFCQYAADGGPAPEFVTMDDELVRRWRPSIHMNRWASRISLEITGVRVERLQDISVGDCCNEGAPLEQTHAVQTWYEELWESINGRGSWDANPWVWVIEFKRV